MTIRPAVSADVSALAALESALFAGDAWSPAQVEEEIAAVDRDVLVADERGAVVGYVVLMHGLDVVDLLRVGVHPQRRRQGIARALLSTALDNSVRVMLEVDAANGGALAFYREQGFRQIDVKRRYYRSGGDAVVMEREEVS